MKIVASILSWLGVVAFLAVAIFLLNQGTEVSEKVCSMTSSIYDLGGLHVTGFTYQCRNQMTHGSYPLWVWLLCFGYALLQVIILLWRRHALSEGNKIACGIATLIFVSIPGGILTLCLPQKELFN